MKKFLMFFLTLSMLLSINATGEVDESLFRGITHWPMGVESYGIYSGDLNNDGFLDVVSADYGSYEVTYIFGDGDGTFSDATKIDMGNSPYGLCLGDVDNDTYLDIIVQTGSSIYLLENNGDETFAAAVSIPYTGSAGAMLLVDLDHDNYNDLVVTAQDFVNDSTKIFINDQSGGFTQIGEYETGQYNYNATSADFNNDTHIDLAITAYGTDQVYILLNDGNGVFTKSSFTLTTSLTHIDPVEINGDSYIDLAILNRSDGEIDFYANDGSGSFTYHSAATIEQYEEGVDYGDFNNDGFFDFAVAGYNAGIYMNTGSNTFTFFDSIFVGNEPYGIIVDNVNGDAYDDIIVMAKPYDVSYDTGFVAVILNDGSGDFVRAESYSSIDQMQSFCDVDIDNDGDDDLACLSWWNTNPDQITILENDGFGNFTFNQNFNTGAEKAWCIASAKLNSDDYEDLVVGYSDGTIISVHLTTGSGTYAAPVNYTVQNQPRSVFCADMNGDTFIDLIAANYSSGTVSILNNNGNGVFAAAVNTSVGANSRCVFGADFVGNDGDVDLVFTDPLNDRLILMHNNGNGTLVNTDFITTGDYVEDVIGKDFDGDGDIDIACANYGDNTITVFENNNNLSFFNPGTFYVGVEPLAIDAADFDNDGDVDIAVINEGGYNLTVLYNDGSRNFTIESSYVNGDDTENLIISDFNKDGFNDIAFNDYSNGSVKIMMNMYLVITDVDDFAVNDILPDEYKLSQNYPNPFNPTTRIEYSLPVKSQVSITIYNLLGQVVNRFDRGIQAAGEHYVEWDGTSRSGSKVASGLYFYRLEAGSFVGSKKMLLLK